MKKTKRLLFFILNFLLLILAVNSPAAENPYPAEIQKFIDDPSLKKVACELEKPRRIGVNFYRNDNKETPLLRVYTKDGEELEAWINYKEKFLGEIRPDKIFYNTETNGWIDAEDITPDEGGKLNERLIFTWKEKNRIKKCYEGGYTN